MAIRLTREERRELDAQYNNVKRQKINLTLHPDTILLARKFGEGNVSRGIDTAVMAYHERKKRA